MKPGRELGEAQCSAGILRALLNLRGCGLPRPDVVSGEAGATAALLPLFSEKE